MATLTLKGRSKPVSALLERARAVEAKGQAERKWADGKLSKGEMQRVVSKANDKLRGA